MGVDVLDLPPPKFVMIFSIDTKQQISHFYIQMMHNLEG
jgi:hypothetical protein